MVTSNQTDSSPLISRSLRRLQRRVSRAYIATPPPGLSHLSALEGGKKLRRAISVSDVLGLSQVSLKTAMSYSSDSALIRSILGNRLCTFKWIMLRWFVSISREVELEKLLSDSVFTDSGPGFGWISPVNINRQPIHNRKQAFDRIRIHVLENFTLQSGDIIFLL